MLAYASLANKARDTTGPCSQEGTTMRDDSYDILADDEPAPAERRLASLAVAITLLLACVFYPSLLIDTQGHTDALRTVMAIGVITAGLVHGLWID
jgi:hypothetical protein